MDTVTVSIGEPLYRSSVVVPTSLPAEIVPSGALVSSVAASGPVSSVLTAGGVSSCVVPSGPPGPPGPPGPNNLFIQQTNPNMTSPGLWWEIDALKNLTTLWVETG